MATKNNNKYNYKKPCKSIVERISYEILHLIYWHPEDKEKSMREDKPFKPYYARFDIKGANLAMEQLMEVVQPELYKYWKNGRIQRYLDQLKGLPAGQKHKEEMIWGCDRCKDLQPTQITTVSYSLNNHKENLCSKCQPQKQHIKKLDL